MRLTKKKNGEVYCAFSDICNQDCCGCWTDSARMTRLAEYEETGMEPGGLMEMKERTELGQKLAKIMEYRTGKSLGDLVEAAEDKSLIVLPKTARIESVREEYCGGGVMVDVKFRVKPPFVQIENFAPPLANALDAIIKQEGK